MSEPTQAKTDLILIVDDTLKNVQLLGSILKGAGYRIAVATNGLDAIHAAFAEQPNLILLDIMMPMMDGFSAAKELKSRPETAGIPIIFLTARVEPEDIVKGFDLGAVDYVTKPFHQQELLVRVKNHLELHHAQAAIEQQSNARKELLHILSHDLANSLGSIMGLLRVCQCAEDFLSLRGAMLQATENSLDVIELVRKLRALEDHKLDLAMEEIDLAQSVQAAWQLLSGRFESKGIVFDCVMEPGLKVWAEKTSFINSVLNNLFTNGIKFSYPGQSLRVRAKRLGDLAELKISDDGIGIPESMQTQIFDPGKVTHRAGTNEESGTGFGMPLVMKFIQLYGGNITLKSKDERKNPESHGTQFTILLPLKPPAGQTSKAGF